MTENKDTVIGALIERFACSESTMEAELIRASCENIYQWGRLQGMNEALEKMRGAYTGEDKG